jgi:hypothetical protein
MFPVSTPGMSIFFPSSSSRPSPDIAKDFSRFLIETPFSERITLVGIILISCQSERLIRGECGRVPCLPRFRVWVASGVFCFGKDQTFPCPLHCTCGEQRAAGQRGSGHFSEELSC